MDCKTVGPACGDLDKSHFCSGPLRGMVGCTSRALLILWFIQERESWVHIPLCQCREGGALVRPHRNECKTAIWMSLCCQIEVNGAKTVWGIWVGFSEEIFLKSEGGQAGVD